MFSSWKVMVAKVDSPAPFDPHNDAIWAHGAQCEGDCTGPVNIKKESGYTITIAAPTPAGPYQMEAAPNSSHRVFTESYNPYGFLDVRPQEDAISNDNSFFKKNGKIAVISDNRLTLRIHSSHYSLQQVFLYWCCI